MTIEHFSEHLHLIPLDLPREGFHHFIGVWIYSTDKTVILIDPGPSSTVQALMKALEEMKIHYIDLILLTHIHTDHSGGLGTLLTHYPDAKVICHPKGIPHLIEGVKLWEASKKVLGDIAELYGKPDPTPGQNIDFKDHVSMSDTTVRIFETPGHASHHLSFQIGDLFFVGEAMGMFYQREKDFYLRISSPLGFRIDDYMKSLALLKDLDAAALCFSHYGLTREIEKVLKLAVTQVEIWSKVIGRYQTLDTPIFEEKVLGALVTEDPGLSCFHQLPDDIKRRELDLLGNSFRGFRAALNMDR